MIRALGFLTLRAAGLVMALFPGIYLSWVVAPILAGERPPDIWAERPFGVAIAAAYGIAALVLIVPKLGERVVAWRPEARVPRFLWRLGLFTTVTIAFALTVPLFDPREEVVLLPGGTAAMLVVAGVWVAFLVLCIWPGLYVQRLRAEADAVQETIHEVFDRGPKSENARAAARAARGLAQRTARGRR